MTGDVGPLIFLHAMDLPSILFRSRHECRGGEANILCPVQLFILPFCHQLEHVAAIEVVVNWGFHKIGFLLWIQMFIWGQVTVF